MAEAGARPPKIMWCEFRGQIALDGEARSQVEPPESLYPACFLAFRRSGAARGSGPDPRLTNSPIERPTSWIPLLCEYRPQALGSASRHQPPRRPACARLRVSHWWFPAPAGDLRGESDSG